MEEALGAAVLRIKETRLTPPLSVGSRPFIVRDVGTSPTRGCSSCVSAPSPYLTAGRQKGHHAPTAAVRGYARDTATRLSLALKTNTHLNKTTNCFKVAPVGLFHWISCLLKIYPQKREKKHVNYCNYNTL